MCQAYYDARQASIKSRERYADFVALLAYEASAYFGVPRERIGFFNPTANQTAIGIHEALESQADGSYHLGFAIRLHERTDGSGVNAEVVLEIKIRKVVQVTVQEWPKSFKIPIPHTPEQLHDLLDGIHKLIISWSEADLKKFTL